MQCISHYFLKGRKFGLSSTSFAAYLHTVRPIKLGRDTFVFYYSKLIIIYLQSLSVPSNRWCRLLYCPLKDILLCSTWLYIGSKLLNSVNIIIQLMLISRYVGDGGFFWGRRVISFSILGFPIQNTRFFMVLTNTLSVFWSSSTLISCV